MNRTEEYEALMAELNELPALKETEARAETKYRKERRARRGVTAALSSLGGVAAAFVLLVNISLPFAQACGKIPFLKELAQAVAFSPSLSAAVENEYVQPIDQTQSANGVTMTVRYLIADNRQMIVFYTLKSDDPGLYLECYPDLRPAVDGQELPGHGISWSASGSEDETDLRSFTVLFSDPEHTELPEEFVLEAEIRASRALAQEGPVAAPEQHISDLPPEEPPTEEVAALTFPIRVDLSKIRSERVYDIQQEITLDGQTVTVERLEVYPTFMQLVLSDHEENSAWLVSLDFYLEDNRGRTYGQSGGITALGSPDSPFWPLHLVDSSYFSDASSYTLHITDAVWLDKDMETVTIDLETGKAGPLPEIIQDFTIEPKHGGYYFEFYFEETHRGMFHHTCRDSQGKEYDIPSVSFSSRIAGKLDPLPDGVERDRPYSTESFLVRDFSDTEITLGLSYSRISEFDPGVTVKIG